MTRLTYGGIAQLARAFGSYPECRWFESNCRYQFWPGGQEVKTPPFHGGNTSSILVRVTRATKQMSQSADQKFVRSGFWHLYFLGRVAQLVRALASHARGPRFESVRVHHEKSTCICKCFFQRNKSLSGFVKCPTGVKYACGVWNRCGGEGFISFHLMRSIKFHNSRSELFHVEHGETFHFTKARFGDYAAAVRTLPSFKPSACKCGRSVCYMYFMRSGLLSFLASCIIENVPLLFPSQKQIT